MPYHVFISWSGKRSGLIAEGLREFIERVFEESLKGRVFLSKRDIRTGANWSEKINSALRESKFGIICLTPENKSTPWPLFEAGALSKTAGEISVCPYLHELTAKELGRPLEQFNATTTTQEGTLKLIEDINSTLVEKLTSNQLKAMFAYRWSALKERLDKVPTLDSDTGLRLSKLQQELPELISSLRDRPEFSENTYFAHVIGDVLFRLKRNLESAGTCFDVPLTLYPAHLVSLLDRFKEGINVKAVAIVDSTERFWPQREGERILKASQNNSTRIFVFHEREHLKANLAWLAHHAGEYDVYVTSYKRLASLGPELLRDFSIVGGSAKPLLAYYAEAPSSRESSVPIKMIRFSIDPTEIADHEDAFSRMLRLSVRVCGGASGSAIPEGLLLNPEDEESVDKLTDSIFEQPSKSFQKKQVEMSSYIDLLEYDLHEEEHVFYCEMMDRMIDLSGLRKKPLGKRARVAEFGAGTGLFTKRLAELSETEIVAVELDWACYHLLRLKMEAARKEMQQRNSKFCPENRDCRTFNPDGHFDCIFSSFADHHIFLTDKGRYFQNVKRNLLDDGLFIVGDEFLPEHDQRLPAEREAALKSYHHYVIEQAKAHSHTHLAALEKEALESGLKSIGDFKVSCQHYESLAKKSGLALVSKHKIGPLEDDQVGGVYVYVFKGEK